ncbi:SDR family oxidoreductase [Dyadobacter frigoris]|uniref:SDR family NAD(P)-dependent oxidoreductase n=1 Tax=Dyadobacter frigoris TaxID=2576211 RepID=A0A4U6D3V7_9BACT|nr:SDR family NAD(P)-dependent oxidoreductase [Dyadobacter frigoris]TKT91999.1 SDR family NAD(P)-dependent oxidoreductase [Dyadobacter frigoris]GLU53125.1 putative oxidoreductase DltE [Dyadobacter frigoris]
MKTINNTVLITGGSAGIGFEIAKLLSEKGNKVIITGRDETRLKNALSKLPDVVGFAYDVTIEEDVDKLIETLTKDFPTLNMVINNAGKANLSKLAEKADIFQKAGEEMLTNYLSILRINEKLLSLLGAQKEAAIVNVSSIVAFVPNHVMATYGATKAALHSYSQSLRIALAKSTSIKVFELMPPLVNTDFSQEIGGANGISPVIVAEDLINALETDTYEIHVGRTAQIFELFHASPAEALAAMNPN